MSLTKVSYSLIDGAPINVVDYGFATTASAATNKAALLAAIAAGGEGSLIVIPDGTFEIDGEIQINKKGITIRGAGSNYRYSPDDGFTGTQLKFMSGTSGFDLTNTDTVYATSSEYTALYNLNINGNNILVNGIYVKGCKLIENCTVQRCTAAGIVLGGFVNSTIVKQCGLVLNGIGILINGVSNTIFLVTQCNIRQNRIGVKIEQDVGGTFAQCGIESNTSWGFLINVAAGETVGVITLEKVWFENNGFGLNEPAVQQVLITGIDSNPSIYSLTFNECTFDVGSNTTKQDLYVDGGIYTRFNRCRFSNRTGIPYGIVLTGKAQYTMFFNCEVGAQFGGEFYYISNSGIGTYMQPLAQTYVGPNLQASSTWTNSGYSTFTSTGNKITSAISTGGSVSASITAGITRSKGVSYVLQWLITLNSGQKPTITLTNGNNTAQLINQPYVAASVERAYYTETITGSSGVLTISNTAASNWKMEVNLIEYEVARGYIDINAG